jgi:hypothetical protein
MKSCQYCAQTNTRLDAFGYCKRYNCFEHSGKNKVLQNIKLGIRSIAFSPDVQCNAGRIVTNTYSANHRKIDDLKHRAILEFGFMPLELLSAIPSKFAGKWDKNIRW